MPSQQRVNWAKFRVSAVSFVALLILSVLVYLLTGGTLLSQKAPLYLYMPDGEGLEAQAVVRVDGVDVGTVKSVVLSGLADPNRAVRVTMDIDRGRFSQIPVSSEAEIDSDSLIGDQYVNVTSHPFNTAVSPEMLKPGGEMRLKKPTDLKSAINIIDVERQLRLVDALLQDVEAGRGDLGQFVKGRKVYDDVVHRISEIEADIRTGVAATTEVGHALYQDALYRKFVDSVNQVDQTLARLESGQGADGHFLRDPAQYAAWLNSLRDIRKQLADLRAQPMMQSGDQYRQWANGLDAMIQRVDDINSDPLLHSTEMYENLAGWALEMQKTVRDFREHPQKYLRMALF